MYSDVPSSSGHRILRIGRRIADNVDMMALLFAMSDSPVSKARRRTYSSHFTRRARQVQHPVKHLVRVLSADFMMMSASPAWTLGEQDQNGKVGAISLAVIFLSPFFVTRLAGKQATALTPFDGPRNITSLILTDF